VTSLELPKASRLLIRARLAPLQGSRFQPTGFPRSRRRALPPARTAPRCCWSSRRSRWRTAWRPRAGTKRRASWSSRCGACPTVDVWEEGQQLTNSLMEAPPPQLGLHREERLSADARAGDRLLQRTSPSNREKLVKAVCKFDPNALLHGVFLESIAGVLRLPRALSGFIEAPRRARGRQRRREERQRSREQGRGRRGQDADGGRGLRQTFPITESSSPAAEIDAFFNLDLAQLRSYRLPAATTKLLYALAIYKIQAFLDRGLRLRTACDFQVLGVEVTRPEGVTLPSEGRGCRRAFEADPGRDQGRRVCKPRGHASKLLAQGWGEGRSGREARKQEIRQEGEGVGAAVIGLRLTFTAGRYHATGLGSPTSTKVWPSGHLHLGRIPASAGGCELPAR
jgi:CRISPR-associated protein Csb1